MEVKGRRVADYDACTEPGDFYFTPPNPHDGGMRRLSFRCPCGCGALAGIRVRDDGQQDGQAWGWNRDEEKPTATPSIRIGPGEHWHGYLTDGVFRSC